MSDFTIVIELLPPQLADRINEHSHAANVHARAALLQAREAGRLLIEARAQCPDGQWGTWLACNTRISPQTARAFMQLANY